ncbi:hypothetical protein N9N28_08620 [Rubripirellula amarantea]|uniref:Uncharacterized protein n=1 Tax=Rubripirellula amarantea TaxID=2527999 RepID=A0A5C5WUS0_9BACT|nr:hypothetical protein [Rubripirellula amarantea]MDA8744681.1 hypothetical protein [Rubripirellula amarantea]TWT54396.1 hypothetical protein Pla22_20430 [Rubripirellula amarantea]
MKIFTLRIACLTVCAFAVTLAGCATWSKNDKSKKEDSGSFFSKIPFVGKGKEEPEEYPKPVKLVATWTADTLMQTGRTPTRGFGGRVFFYDEKSRPVPVDGTLVIHGFDDTADTEQRRLKRFEFTPEQFTRHFSQTDLGASYSVWVPWDAIGGDQRRISLVASFKTKQGEMVQGIPATVLLPGKKQSVEQVEIANHSPQYKQYREATLNAAPRSGLMTTTIARRESTLNRQDSPGLNIPTMQSSNSQIASGNTSGKTPSMDLEISPRQRIPGAASPQILPASAVLPSK